MTIGYVTIAEANQYVETHYLSSSSERTSWQDLSPEDKDVLLMLSYESIETLPFSGRPTQVGQLKAFPREGSSSVPEAVKSAQCSNAVYMSDTSKRADSKFYDKLKSHGIQSYSIGNLSESILDLKGDAANASGIFCQEAIRYLQPFLRGGFRIR